MSRAASKSPLQQWAALRQHEAAIIRQLEQGRSLTRILPQYGITPAYWQKYKSHAQQAAVAVSMHVKRLMARNRSVTNNQ